GDTTSPDATSSRALMAPSRRRPSMWPASTTVPSPWPGTAPAAHHPTREGSSGSCSSPDGSTPTATTSAATPASVTAAGGTGVGAWATAETMPGTTHAGPATSGTVTDDDTGASAVVDPKSSARTTGS